MSNKYEQLSTDELLDLLPDHLHIARNNQAAMNDRFRMFNQCTEKYTQQGFDSARELLIHTLVNIGN